ncbi:MAG TPA: hypothetical protein VHH11_07915 [Gammaproteobacteria bacterium]|jgi:hypothetical protein|nr:hypothetical protein [Gammaproteobacteria bacterium]
MNPTSRLYPWLAALCGALLLAAAARADDAAGAPAAPEVTLPASPVDDQVVVTGRGIAEIREQIRLAEDAVYARFNDINSDDRFDIHCVTRASIGTHIEHRECRSNSWMEEDANYASATLGALRGEYGMNPEAYHARQLDMQQRLDQEFRRLLRQDPQLRKDMEQLGQAYLALNAATDRATLYREVPATDPRYPAEARHMLDVRVGADPWTYHLTEHTFTLTAVVGHVRSMRLDCDNGGTTLAFKDDAEWNVPAAWGRCDLIVGARRNTTFAFVEFP